jgi:AcrR family transcriptional regulator
VGYEKASMRAVAQSAEVSLAGLYNYFDCKETMLFLIQFRTFTSLMSTLRENHHGVEDPEEQLKVLVRAHVPVSRPPDLVGLQGEKLETFECHDKLRFRCH